KRGRLVMSRVRYEGFERVDRLVPTALLEGDPTPLPPDCAAWLLEQPPRESDHHPLPSEMDEWIEDAIDESVFIDQAEVAAQEQQLFDRSLEQIERYMEDRILVLRKRLAVAHKALGAAESRRDAALGSEARDEADRRIDTIQKEIEELDAEI